MPVNTSCRQHRSRFSRYLTGLLVVLPVATASAQSAPSEPLTASAVSSPGAHPGAFSLNGPMTVLQVLALAGGMNEFSKPGDTIVVP